MKRIFAILITVVIVFMAGNLAFAATPTVESLLRDGVQLHDRGEYDAAIEKYQAALNMEPRNSVVLYELAYTYAVKGTYTECIDSAKRGLETPSSLESQLYALQGSCFSSQGKASEALSVFRLGLAKYPDDSGLNYNMAVTLMGQRLFDDAVSHLKTVLRVRPTYASPYFLLAQAFQQKGYRVPSLFLYLRFLTLETNTSRSVFAAQQVDKLLNSGVTKENGKIDVSVNMKGNGVEGDFAPLELALSLVAANNYTEEGQARKPADKLANSLTAFLQISAEVDQDKFTNTFTWDWAMKKVLLLWDKGVLEPFSYFVAVRAQLDGGSDWLKAHSVELSQLNNALKQMNSGE